MNSIKYQQVNNSNSNESISATKTIDLEEMQKEVDTMKSRMKNTRMNIIESNRLSNDTIHLKNREISDNFIKHHSLNNRSGSYFDEKDKNLKAFKFNQNEIKIPECVGKEAEPKSE